jgi:hypothetical protein
MGDAEVVKLLNIASGYLARVRLEYDRINEELNSTKTELSSLKAELKNEARVFQQFCDQNLKLKTEKMSFDCLLINWKQERVNYRKLLMNFKSTFQCLRKIEPTTLTPLT